MKVLGIYYPTVVGVLEGTCAMSDMFVKPYGAQHYLQPHPRHTQQLDHQMCSWPSLNILPLLGDEVFQREWYRQRYATSL